MTEAAFSLKALATLLGSGLVAGSVWQVASALVFNRAPKGYRLGAMRRGEGARVVEWSNGVGIVDTGGEHWRARCNRDFRVGDAVKITSSDGLTLNIVSAERRGPSLRGPGLGDKAG